MFDEKKTELTALKERFERELEVDPPEAGRVGQAFLNASDHGPPADPQVVALDTTGTMSRDQEYTDWVAEEHIRVRRALAEGRAQPTLGPRTRGSG